MNNPRSIKLIDFLQRNFLPRSTRVLNIVSILSLVGSVIIFYVMLPILFNTDWKDPVLKYGAQKYTDIVVGSITWSDYYKSFDYIVTYLFLGVFFIVWISLTPLINRISSEKVAVRNVILNERRDIIALYLIVGFLSYSLALWFMRGIFPTFEILITCILAVMGLVLYLKSWSANTSESVNLPEFSNKLVAVFLATVFSYFSVIGLLAFVKFIDSSFLLNDVSVIRQRPPTLTIGISRLSRILRTVFSDNFVKRHTSDIDSHGVIFGRASGNYSFRPPAAGIFFI